MTEEGRCTPTLRASCIANGPTSPLWLGPKRASLLALMVKSGADDLAATTLGIFRNQTRATLSEWSLITTSRSGNELADVWGLPHGANIFIIDPDSGDRHDGSLPAVLGRASILLDRMRVELDELDALLSTFFVNGPALDNRKQCKASEMTFGGGQTEALFDRLHRFTRFTRFTRLTRL